MSSQSEFPIIFENLKSILKPYATKLTLKGSLDGNFQLEGPYSQKWKKELFFASAQVRKNYVSFYLMPVYMYPDLLKDISPELRKHMQGKSCFNFKRVEPTLFTELSKLTKVAFDCFMKKEFS